MPTKKFNSTTAKAAAKASEAQKAEVKKNTAKTLANEVLRTVALAEKANEKANGAKSNLADYLQDNNQDRLYHRGHVFNVNYRGKLEVEECPTSDNFKEVPPEPENEDELVDAANEGGDEENAA